MIRQLWLTNFKSFRQASLEFGGLTLLVGTNAAGKSNLRDALRFLHGVGRGYSLSDIIGGRFGEGGERIWGGIRGGPREIAFDGASTFALDISLQLDDQTQTQLDYHIEVDPGREGSAFLVSEWIRLRNDYPQAYLFFTETSRRSPALKVWMRRIHSRSRGPWVGNQEMPDVAAQQKDLAALQGFYYSDDIASQRPALMQLIESNNPRINAELKKQLQYVADELISMRFLDLNPDAMRNPSFPGQITLGDRGENLSSVLQAICADEARKQALVSWLQALTPMDAVDFEFPADPIGKIVAILIEFSGRRTTAYSASDGTLRFLAMLAAMLGPEPAQLYVFEELENGIHPTRLHLLLQLIEQQTARHATQVLATTHSPQLLRLIAPQTLEATSIVYRLPGHPDFEIRRLLDIPNAQQTLQREDLAQLHDSGWLEDAVAFAADEDA